MTSRNSSEYRNDFAVTEFGIKVPQKYKSKRRKGNTPNNVKKNNSGKEKRLVINALITTRLKTINNSGLKKIDALKKMKEIFC